MLRFHSSVNGQHFSCYDKFVQMTESGRAKKHVFCCDGKVAGTGCKTLACALAKSWYAVSSVQICLAANGPAVAGVSVTRRSHPATGPGSLAEIESRWQDGYGMCFCNPGTKFGEYWRVRGTMLLSDSILVPVL
jgi:hypothetical protein